MLLEVIGWTLAALIGWSIAHVYYRRTKADSTARFEALRAATKHLVAAAHGGG
jgi:hypothetical protein